MAISPDVAAWWRGPAGWVAWGWRDPDRRAGALAAVAAFAVLQCLFAVWVHHCFEGKYQGPFLISRVFGVPAREAARGIEPVMGSSWHGWDGQFYYHISNDLLGRRDTPRHLDNITYRYQRIGIPLLARGLCTLAGRSVTSPFLYHALQIALTAAGFGVLVYWLRRLGVHPLYALTWLAGSGTLHSLFYGLPDAPAEAVFILCLFALWHRRLALYAASATLLVLIREGYVVVPFFVFLFTAAGRLAWDGNRRYLTRVALTALPGVVVVAWATYLMVHFQVSYLDPQRSPPGLYGWPFQAFWKCLGLHFQAGLEREVLYKCVGAFTLAVVLLVLLRRLRAALPLACVLPYVLLTASLGTIVWEAASGYLKANGSVLIVGLLLLPLDRSILLRFVLAVNLFVGLDFTFLTPVLTRPLVSSLKKDEVPGVRPGEPVTPVLSDFRSSVAWLDYRPELTVPYHGPWRRVHRELIPLHVAVTNHSSVPWLPNPRRGHNAINLALHLLAPDSPVIRHEGRVSLERPLLPGETRVLTAWLPHWPGDYRVRLSMVQEEQTYFFAREPSAEACYPIKIR